MKYLLDTDHLSILQRQTGEAYDNLTQRMAQHSPTDFAISIVTFHEQMLGSHAYINRARSLNQVTKGYELMARIVSDFRLMPVLPFDANAAIAYAELQAQRIQLAKMDTRIAAIALSQNLTVLTRNHRDFGKVSGLAIEDWTPNRR
ncbi:MAG: type II toxin-antitoxin system VapC family toxin [Oscillatoriales cyanobacterium]|nr:MAG: type II toxin-antitoxin system VapC family toxin [Oscillatoriales cyanobacterium]